MWIAPVIDLTEEARAELRGAEIQCLRTLLDHLDALTRNTMGTMSWRTRDFEMPAFPTPVQRRVCEWLGEPAPLEPCRFYRASGL